MGMNYIKHINATNTVLSMYNVNMDHFRVNMLSILEYPISTNYHDDVYLLKRIASCHRIRIY